MNKQIYCTAPWNGLTIRENGDVKTCCAGARTLGNLNFVSIREIENSLELKNIQQGMLDGTPDYENCKLCVDSEKISGYATLRDHYNRWYPDTNDNQLFLKFIDIRWNNVCNLACMYCNSTFSSTWADRLPDNKKNQPVKQYQDELLSWILERASHVNEIMLVGGEPMLMKQNYELLRQLPKDCKISIITNLSYDLANNPALPFLLDRDPDKVNWNVSIENTGQKFEYVRTGSNWLQTKKNFELLVKHWPNTVTLNMVYSVFSAFDIADTIKHFHYAGVKKFNLFNVNENEPISVFKMPSKVKKVALDQLKLAHQCHIDSLHPEDRDLYPWQGIESLMSALENPEFNLISFEEFEKKIVWYDQWSKTKFYDLWPDVYNLIRSSLK